MTHREKRLAIIIIALSVAAPYAAYRAFKMGVREGLNLVKVMRIPPTPAKPTTDT